MLRDARRIRGNVSAREVDELSLLREQHGTAEPRRDEAWDAHAAAKLAHAAALSQPLCDALVAEEQPLCQRR